MQEKNPFSMYITTDVIEEIFVRLPLKSLGKFKSVSKEWKSILESKIFVDMHLSLQKSEKTRRRKFLAAHNCDCGVSPSLLPESRFEGDEEFVSLRCDATRPSMSCDGLVCIPEPGCVNVLNPSTGQLRRFHSPSLLNRHNNSTFTNGTWSTYFPGYCAMGFGRDSVKGSYKVVRMFDDPNYSDILDVNTGEWTKLKKPKVDVGRKSACVNGSIYWLRIMPQGVSGSIYSILALDLHTEEFHYVSLPPLPKGIMFEAQIVNIEDRLAIAMPERNIVREWELEIWTMDARKETWSKTHSISLVSLGINPGESRSFTPVTLSKQGNVVFYDNKKRLFKYYPETNQIQSLSPDICVISPYLENLVPLQTQQVELRTGITCIRGTTDGIQSRVDEFLCKGIDIGAWLWKKKILVFATYLLAQFLCNCFCSRDIVFCAPKLILLGLLARSGYCGSIIRVTLQATIMMKLFSIINNF